MILAATLLWSVEVVSARRLLAREGVSVRLAATSRMALGAVLIVGFLVVTGRVVARRPPGAQWRIVAATGLLLLGYVTTWYAALQRAPALVTTVLVGGAVVTAALASRGPARSRHRRSSPGSACWRSASGWSRDGSAHAG